MPAGHEWSFKVQLSHVHVRNLATAIENHGVGTSTPDDGNGERDATHPHSRGDNTADQHNDAAAARAARESLSSSLLPDLLCVLRFAFDGKVQDFPLVPCRTQRGNEDSDDNDDDAPKRQRNSSRGGDSAESEEETEGSISFSEADIKDLTTDPDYSAFVYRIRSESVEALVSTLQKRYATLQVLLLAPAGPAPVPAAELTSGERNNNMDHSRDGTTGAGENSPFCSEPDNYAVLAVLGSATASLYELLIAKDNPLHLYSFSLLEKRGDTETPGAASRPHPRGTATPRRPRNETRACEEVAREGETGRPPRAPAAGPGDGSVSNGSVHTSDFDAAEKASEMTSSASDNNGSEFQRGSPDEGGTRKGAWRQLHRRRRCCVSAMITMSEVSNVTIRFSTLTASNVRRSPSSPTPTSSEDTSAGGGGSMFRLRYHLVAPTLRGSSSSSSRNASTSQRCRSRSGKEGGSGVCVTCAPHTRAAQPCPVTATETPVRDRAKLSPLKQRYIADGEALLGKNRVATSAVQVSEPVELGHDGSAVFMADRDLPPLTVKATRLGLSQQRVMFTLSRDNEGTGAHQTSSSAAGGGRGAGDEVLQWQYEVPLEELMRSATRESATQSFVVMGAIPGEALPTESLPDPSRSSLKGSVELHHIPCLVTHTMGRTEEAAAAPQDDAVDSVKGDGEGVGADDKGNALPLHEPLAIRTTHLDGPQQRDGARLGESTDTSVMSPAMPPTPPSPPHLNVDDTVSQAISLIAERTSSLGDRKRELHHHHHHHPTERTADSNVLLSAPLPDSRAAWDGEEDAEVEVEVPADLRKASTREFDPAASTHSRDSTPTREGGPHGGSFPRHTHTAGTTTARNERGGEYGGSGSHTTRRSASQDVAAREATRAMRLAFEPSANPPQMETATYRPLSPDAPPPSDKSSVRPSSRPAHRAALLRHPSECQSGAVAESLTTDGPRFPALPLCSSSIMAALGPGFPASESSEAGKRKVGEVAAVYRNVLEAYQAQAERAKMAWDAWKRLDAEVEERHATHDRAPVSAAAGAKEEEDSDGAVSFGDLLSRLSSEERRLMRDIGEAESHLGQLRERMAENTEAYKAAKRRLDADGQYVAKGMAALTEVEGDLESLLADAEAQLHQTRQSNARAVEETRRVQAHIGEREHTLSILEGQLRDSVLRHDEIRGITSVSAGGTPMVAQQHPSSSSRDAVPGTFLTATHQEPERHSWHQQQQQQQQQQQLTPSPPQSRAVDETQGGGANIGTVPSVHVVRRLSLAALSGGNDGGSSRTGETNGEAYAEGEGHTTVGNARRPSSASWGRFLSSSLAARPHAEVSAHPYASARPAATTASTTSPLHIAAMQSPPVPLPHERRHGTQTTPLSSQRRPSTTATVPASRSLRLPTAGVTAPPLSATPAWLREVARQQLPPPATSATTASSRDSASVDVDPKAERRDVLRLSQPSLLDSRNDGYAHQRKTFDGFAEEGMHPHTPPLSAASSPNRPRSAANLHSHQQQPTPRRDICGGPQMHEGAQSDADRDLSTLSQWQVELDALLDAIDNGDDDVSMHLLLTKPNMAQKSDTLLHAACAAPQGASEAVVKTLLKLRPDLVKRVDALSGSTALHHACAAARPSIPVIRALLLAGVPPDVRNAEGYTALHVALLNKADLPLHKVKDTLLALSPRGSVNINERTARGQTPLHLVCGSDGNVAVVRYLLSRGADVWARASFVNPIAGGRVHEVTPMELSREMGAMVVCQMIEKAALNISVDVY